MVHTQCAIPVIGLSDKTELEAGPVKTSIRYINRTPIDITVVERNGLRHVVPSNMNNGPQVFIIRKEIRIEPQYVPEVKKFLACVDSKNDELVKIKMHVLGDKTNATYNAVRFFTDHEITLSMLKTGEGTVYCKPSDVVVSSLNVYSCPPHPYSEDTISDYVLQNHSPPKYGSPYFRIELIDSNDGVGNRYMKVFGDMHEVSPVKSVDKPDGVYLTYLVPSLNPDLAFSLARNVYTFQEAEEVLGIFKSKELAENYGDIKQGRKEELAKGEHATTLLKQELIDTKLQHEVDQTEKDRIISDLEYSRKIEEAKLSERIRILEREKVEIEHLRDLEKNIRKDYYENRSYERKDQSEVVKFIPYMIMGIGAIIVAIMKLSPTK